jgi:hypothetical protein
MPKHIELTARESGMRAIAVLHEGAAPETCAGVWSCLETPLQVPAIHAMMAGREIFVEIPESQQKFDPSELPPENQTVTPLPGEIGFIYFPPHALINNQRAGEVDRAKAMFDIAIFYGRDCRLFIANGWVPANIFATIEEGLPEFAFFCERIRKEGEKVLTIRRLDEATHNSARRKQPTAAKKLAGRR